MTLRVDLDARGYPDTSRGREAALRATFEKCKKRLEEKADLGKSRWNEPRWIAEDSVAALEHKFHVAAANGFPEKDLVDVMNYCMFIVAAYEKGVLAEDGIVDV